MPDNVSLFYKVKMKSYHNNLLAALIVSSIFFEFFSCNPKPVSNTNKNETQDSTLMIKDTSNIQSVYQLDGEWVNQDNQSIKLTDLKGKIQVVAMIFSSCKYACPKIVDDMKKIEKQIPEDKKNKIGFTLISFDVDRDTPEQLKKFSKEMKLNEHWNLLRSNEQQVRELSMLLDVKYEKQ